MKPVQRPATIKDIRKETGLALSTISKYINGGNVKSENARLIQSAIRKLNYQVNESARGLITRKTRLVGVMVYSLESLFAGTIVHHISDFLRAAGYAAVICDSGSSEAYEEENMHFLLQKRVDGIIALPCGRVGRYMKEVVDAGVPLVTVDNVYSGVECDRVTIDNRTASGSATGLLIEHGHKKIAVIYSDQSYTGTQRWLGFYEAMQKASLPVPESYRKYGSYSIELGRLSMGELLDLPDPPTAVLATNYEVMIGAVEALNEFSVSCPEDISMIGIDNLMLSHIVKPRMYTIIQPMKTMAEECVRILLRRLEEDHESPPVHVELGTRIGAGSSIRRM